MSRTMEIRERAVGPGGPAALKSNQRCRLELLQSCRLPHCNKRWKKPEKAALPKDVTMLQVRADVAKARGMTLLSTQWMGDRALYRFECAKGHLLERRANVMRRGTATCLQCAYDEAAQRFVDSLRERGLVCLDERYAGVNVHHRFRCTEGREWRTRPDPCAAARTSVIYWRKSSMWDQLNRPRCLSVAASAIAAP